MAEIQNEGAESFSGEKKDRTETFFRVKNDGATTFLREKDEGPIYLFDCEYFKFSLTFWTLPNKKVYVDSPLLIMPVTID